MYFDDVFFCLQSLHMKHTPCDTTAACACGHHFYYQHVLLACLIFIAKQAFCT